MSTSDEGYPTVTGMAHTEEDRVREIRRRISDPGAFLPRDMGDERTGPESIANWGARAIFAAGYRNSPAQVVTVEGLEELVRIEGAVIRTPSGDTLVSQTGNWYAAGCADVWTSLGLYMDLPATVLYPAPTPPAQVAQPTIREALIETFYQACSPGGAIGGQAFIDIVDAALDGVFETPTPCSPSREAIEDAVLGIELTREFDVTEDDAAIIADAILAPIPPALGNAIPGLQAAVDMAEALTIRPGNSRAEQHRNEDESWTS